MDDLPLLSLPFAGDDIRRLLGERVNTFDIFARCLLSCTA